MIPVISFSIKEFFAQRLTIILIGGLILLLLIFAFGVQLTVERGEVTSLSMFGGKTINGADAQFIARSLAETFLSLGFTAILVLCVIGSGGLMPEMLSNGTMIFLLTRPLKRSAVLCGIVTGVVIAFAAILVGTIAAFWVILWVKSSSISMGLPISTAPLVLAFGGTFVATVVVGLASQSTGLTTAAGFVHVLALSPLISSQATQTVQIHWLEAARVCARILYYILPPVEDLRRSGLVIVFGGDFSMQPYLVASGSLLLMFSVSILILRRKDI